MVRNITLVAGFANALSHLPKRNRWGLFRNITRCQALLTGSSSEVKNDVRMTAYIHFVWRNQFNTDQPDTVLLSHLYYHNWVRKANGEANDHQRQDKKQENTLSYFKGSTAKRRILVWMVRLCSTLWSFLLQYGLNRFWSCISVEIFLAQKQFNPSFAGRSDSFSFQSA